MREKEWPFKPNWGPALLILVITLGFMIAMGEPWGNLFLVSGGIWVGMIVGAFLCGWRPRYEA